MNGIYQHRRAVRLRDGIFPFRKCNLNYIYDNFGADTFFRHRVFRQVMCTYVPVHVQSFSHLSGVAPEARHRIADIVGTISHTDATTICTAEVLSRSNEPSTHKCGTRDKHHQHHQQQRGCATYARKQG